MQGPSAVGVPPDESHQGPHQHQSPHQPYHIRVNRGRSRPDRHLAAAAAGP
jgi:hypothetical protein